MQSLYFPKDVHKKINSLLFNYLWNDKREKIKRNILIKDIEEGGLNMIEVESFVTMLQIKWVKSLLSTEYANWKAIPTFYFNRFGQNFLVFYMNLNSVHQLPKTFQSLPVFYKDLIRRWISLRNINKTSPKSFVDIRKQLLWGNDFIKHNNKMLFFHNWIKSDILFINDIINDNGHINEQYILSKLKNKANWISEIATLRNAIPYNWKVILKSDDSVKTKFKQAYPYFHFKKMTFSHLLINKYTKLF